MLAAVARSGVDVADGQRAPTSGRLEGHLAADALQLTK